MFAWLGSLLHRNQRQSTRPVDFYAPEVASVFGTGISNQPDHATLLRENLLVADMATRAIANRISSLDPLVKVSVTSQGGTLEDEVLDDHPLKMLLDKPHPDISGSQLLRLTSQYVVTVGEAFWLKVGSGLGVAAELHPMPADKVQPIFSGGYTVAYRVETGAGGFVDLPADTVVRFYFPDPEDPRHAEGYLAPSSSVQDASKFSAQHLRKFFQDNAIPKAVMEAGADADPFSPAEWESFVNRWIQSNHQRLGVTSGAPAPVPSDYSIKELSAQTGEQLVPLLEFWQNHMLKTFGVPRSVLGEVVSGDRSSAETNQFVFDEHTIRPIATMIATALTNQLAVDFDERLFVDFDGFVGEEKRFVLERERHDLELKLKSGQQILAQRGDDPEEAGWAAWPVGKVGETPYTGEDMASSLSMLTEQPGDLEDDEDEDEAAPEDRSRSIEFFDPEAEWQRQVAREKQFVPAFRRAMLTVFRQQRDATLGRLEAQRGRAGTEVQKTVFADTGGGYTIRKRARIEVGDLFDPEEWESLFARTTESIRLAIFEEVLSTIGPALGITPEDGGEFVMTEAMREVLRAQGATMVRQVNRTTQRAIARELEAGTVAGESIDELATRIRGVFSSSRRRATTIARTEVLTASQGAQLSSYDQAGVQEKQWNTSRDAAVRDSHQIDGQTVRMGDTFTLGNGEQAEAPGIGASGYPLSAGNRINCRCFVTPVL